MNTNNLTFSLENKAKPVLKWAGGKTALLPQFLKYFPNQFKQYIEPFLGGGAAFFALNNNNSAIINEYNKEIFNLYNVLKEHPLDLCHALELYKKKYSESFYYELRSFEPKNKIEKAARTLFLNKTGYNGLYRQNSKGEFNVPFGKRVKCPDVYNMENILHVSRRLQAAQLFNKDFEDIINLAQKDDFIYCDPPYEPVSETSSFNSYNGQGFNKNDQVRLRDCCIQAAKKGATVAISNSAAPFILELYKKFEIIKINAKRAINSNAQKRGNIEELLIIINEKTV